MITHDIEEALLIGDTLTVLAGAPAKVIRQMENPLRHIPLNERRSPPQFQTWANEWKGEIDFDK